jgi:hypothetical protein
VVPERRRVLVVGILVDVGLPRQDGQLGLTVEARRQVPAVQVGGDARGVRVVVGSVRALVHVQQVAAALPPGGGQVVDPGDLDRLSHGRLDGEAGVRPVVGPDVGVGQLAVQLLLGVDRLDGVLERAVRSGAGRRERGRDRQRIDEGRQAAVDIALAAGAALALEDAAGALADEPVHAVGAVLVQVAAGADRLRAGVGVAGVRRRVRRRAPRVRAVDRREFDAADAFVEAAGDRAGRRIEVDQETRGNGALAAREAPGGRTARLVTDDDPAKVRGWGIQPALDVARHGGAAPDAFSAVAAGDDRRRTGGGEVATGAGPRHASELGIQPGGVAGAGRISHPPAARAAARRTLTPEAVDGVERHAGVLVVPRAVDGQGQGDAVDEGPGGDIARDVELQQHPPREAVVGGPRKDVDARPGAVVREVLAGPGVDAVCDRVVLDGRDAHLGGGCRGSPRE